MSCRATVSLVCKQTTVLSFMPLYFKCMGRR